MFGLFSSPKKQTPPPKAHHRAEYTRHTLNNLHVLRAKSTTYTDHSTPSDPKCYRFREHRGIYYVSWMTALPLPLKCEFSWYTHLNHLTPSKNDPSSFLHVLKRDTSEAKCQSSKELLPTLRHFWEDIKDCSDFQRYDDIAFSFDGTVFSLECTLDHPPNAGEFEWGKTWIDKLHSLNCLGENTLKSIDVENYTPRSGPWNQQRPGQLLMRTPTALVVTPTERLGSSTTTITAELQTALPNIAIASAPENRAEWLRFIKTNTSINAESTYPNKPGLLTIEEHRYSFEWESTCRSKRAIKQMATVLSHLVKQPSMGAYR